METSATWRSVLGGMLLVVIVLMSNAYWVEAVRWADKADEAKFRGDQDDETRCVAQMERSGRVFQAINVLFVLTLIGTVLPAIAPRTSGPCVVLLLAVCGLMVVLGIVYASGRFLVPLR